MTANHEHTPKALSTEFVRDMFEIAAVYTGHSESMEAARLHFDRWFDAEIVAAEQRGAARELRKFAHAQDTWCAEGRDEQRISRIAMRDALLKRANELERADQMEGDND